MEISNEGHVRVSPREVCERLNQSDRLINDVLIPGTPVVFPTHQQYCNFLASCADALGVHPRNILVRGSAKLGFSVSPHPDNAWVELKLDSDIDLAIVDPDYYHYIDREIRMFERDPGNQAFQGIKFKKSVDRRRRDQRAFYTYRYFDLPDIPCANDFIRRVKALPVEKCCGSPRPIDVFVFRDWWSLFSRWEADLRALKKAIASGQVEPGGDSPRPAPENAADQ